MDQNHGLAWTVKTLADYQSTAGFISRVAGQTKTHPASISFES